MKKFDHVAWWLFPETIHNDDPVETATRLKKMGATHAFIYLGTPCGIEASDLEAYRQKIGPLVNACVNAGIETHGCFCSMARSGQPESWHQHFKDGTPTDILCPANPKVQDWIMEQLNGFLDKYPLTGINLEDSYVYVNNASYDPANAGKDNYKAMPTCYCESCQKDAPSDEAKRKAYFENAMTSLVAKISKEVKEKRGLVMSAAARMPYGRDFYLPYQNKIPYWEGWGVCQSHQDFKANWVDWHERGYIDFVCPMSYLRNTRIVELQTMEATSRIKNATENVWMGLGVSLMTAEYSASKNEKDMNDPENIRKQLNMLAEKGQKNVVFFAYHKPWVSDECLNMMSEYFSA